MDEIFEDRVRYKPFEEDATTRVRSYEEHYREKVGAHQQVQVDWRSGSPRRSEMVTDLGTAIGRHRRGQRARGHEEDPELARVIGAICKVFDDMLPQPLPAGQASALNRAPPIGLSLADGRLFRLTAPSATRSSDRLWKVNRLTRHELSLFALGDREQSPRDALPGDLGDPAVAATIPLVRRLRYARTLQAGRLRPTVQPRGSRGGRRCRSSPGPSSAGSRGRGLRAA